jgi:hypothetical protein
MSSLKLVDENLSDEEAREQYIINYLKSVVALEEAIKPYREQKKELRKEYIDNGWLSREDIWSAIKAYRLYMQGTDMDDLNDMFATVEKKLGEKNV